MNTIPTIFNQRQINYTVLGGTEPISKVSMPVTCLVINRSGGLYLSIIIDNLLQKGFENIIFMSPNTNRNSLDEMSRQYPQVRIQIALDDVTPGDLINMGMSVSTTPYVLVLYDDLCTDSVSFNSTIAKKLIEQQKFCLCPKLISASHQIVPICFTPLVEKSVFDVETSSNIPENHYTLYAADWVGFYNRELFMQLGGADYTIESPYWQKIDFFFRAWLWGEKVSIDSLMCFSYSGDLPEENRTIDYSYLRFYLKNLLPVFKNDHAEIPLFSFFAFNLRASCSLKDSIALFKEARRWVNENKYLFKSDASSLVQNWGK